MLEAVSIDTASFSRVSQVDLNFTSNMVKLQYLRILVIDGLTISDIHDDIGKYMNNLGMDVCFSSVFCANTFCVQSWFAV